jgi:hypothetical protein
MTSKQHDIFEDELEADDFLPDEIKPFIPDRIYDYEDEDLYDRGC